MKKILKWIAIILASLIGLVALVIVSLYIVGDYKLNNPYSVQVETIAVPSDAASLERGKHIVQSVSACVGCHGDNLSGKLFIDAPGFVVIYAPNLTSGNGGAGATFKDADWVRTLRHGVDDEGRGLFGMPSVWLQNLSDADLGAVIAYVKSVPAVDNHVPEPQFGFPARILLATGGLELMPDRIARTPRMQAPAPGISAGYGEYLVNIGSCRECHAANLSGNTNPNGPPMGPNLTPGGELRAWSEADFIHTLRAGVAPGGHQLKATMPWQQFGTMSDAELQAIWLYLHSLPPLTPGS